jgi:hypothetical protein
MDYQKPVYLSYDFEHCVLRSVPTKTGLIWYVKFKGEREFNAMKGSGIVTEATLNPVIITKDEYDRF